MRTNWGVKVGVVKFLQLKICSSRLIKVSSLLLILHNLHYLLEKDEKLNVRESFKKLLGVMLFFTNFGNKTTFHATPIYRNQRYF